ncbi:MAG: oligosaccharide flippase family protein [Planctomycetales bacterium]
MTQISPVIRRLLALRPSTYLANVALLAGSTATSQSIGFLATLILSRIYAPDEFGILTVFTSLSGPLMLVVTGQFDQAIPLAKDDEKRARLLEFTLLLVMTCAFLVGIIVLTFPNSIANALGVPVLSKYLWLLPFSLLGAGFFTSLSMWSLQKKAFSVVAASTLQQTVVRVSAQGLLGGAGLKPAGLMLGEVLGSFGGVGRLMWKTWSSDRHLFQTSAKRNWLEIAAEYRRFPLLAMPSAVLNIMANSVPQILLASMFGTAGAGLFGMSQRLTAVPVSLIGNSLGQVFYADLASRRHEIGHHRKRFREMSMILAGIGVVGALLLLLAPYWAGPLLGRRWYEAGAVIAAMAPMLLGRIVVAPVARTYFVYGKQHVLLMLDLFRLLLIVVMFGVAYWNQWSYTTVVWSFSLCMFFVYAIHWLAISQIMRLEQADTAPLASGEASKK